MSPDDPPSGSTPPPSEGIPRPVDSGPTVVGAPVVPPGAYAAGQQSGPSGASGPIGPRSSRRDTWLGKDAPSLYKRIDEEYLPGIAKWAEKRFPSLAVKEIQPEEKLTVADVPEPPGTAFTLTPLPDGRLAVQLTPNGIDIHPTPDGG